MPYLHSGLTVVQLIRGVNHHTLSRPEMNRTNNVFDVDPNVRFLILYKVAQ